MVASSDEVDEFSSHCNKERESSVNSCSVLCKLFNGGNLSASLLNGNPYSRTLEYVKYC